jgi:hypothetical protein
VAPPISTGDPRRSSGWLPTGVVSDERDGKLVHLHGLNLSRAWNLENVAAALPAADPRAGVLRPQRAAPRRHRGDAPQRATTR